jgi:type I restriction enzyme, S subunit
MSDLPRGWVRTTLGQIVLQISYGYTAASTNNPTNSKLLRITDLQNNSVNWSTVPYCDCNEKDIEKYKLKPGDIVVARTGATTGKSFLLTGIPETTIFASYLIRLKTSALSPPEYLALFMQSDNYWEQIIDVSKGTAQPGANASILSTLSVPLPPLAEQKRIVAKLDRLFSRSQSAREELARIPKLIDRYKQAILESAFRGKLTADWRKDNTDLETAQDLLTRLQKHCGYQKKLIDDCTKNDIGERSSLPASWCWVQVEAITEVFLGRQRSPKNHTGLNMRPYVRAANITWNGWDLSDVKEMNFDDRDFKKYTLRVGDVLLNEGSGSADEVGKPAIWQGGIEDCCFQNTLICVRPFEAMSEYLYFVFLHAARSKAFVEETRGVNIHHIGKERLAKFWIALPPLKEQQEIVSRIKFKFESSEEGLNQVNKARTLLERLDQETLSKAFMGNLVPQDPNDEPASVLLDRIRAEQQTQPTTRKIRKSKT